MALYLSSYYAWKARFGGISRSEVQRLKALEAENNKLERLLANSMLKVDLDSIEHGTQQITDQSTLGLYGILFSTQCSIQPICIQVVVLYVLSNMR